MPPAHFSFLLPFLSSICPCLVQTDFISAPCFTPAVTTFCILTCHYNCSHLSVLTPSCPLSISPTLAPTEPPCTGYVQFTPNRRHKSGYFWKTVWAEKTQQLPHFFPVCLCFCQSCLYCGRIIWLFAGLVRVCYHSAMFTVHDPRQYRISGNCCVCVCVCVPLHQTG